MSAAPADSSPSLLQAGRALLLRDLRLVWRRRGDALQPALFALLVVIMFALALGGGRQLLGDFVARGRNAHYDNTIFLVDVPNGPYELRFLMSDQSAEAGVSLAFWTVQLRLK